MAISAPVPGPEAASRLASSREMPCVVVLAGEESFFAEEALAAISKKLFPSGEPAGAVAHLDPLVPADAEKIPSVMEELGTPSLFGEGRLVVIHRAEALGGAAAASDEAGDEDAAGAQDDAEEGARPAPKGATKAPGRRASPITTLVKQATAAAVEGAVLVLVTQKPVRGKGSVSADAISKTGAMLVDCRRLYDAPPPWSRGGSPYDSEVAHWLSRRAKAAHGKTMDARAAHALAVRTGAGLQGLSQALETLASYVGDRPAIAEADVAATVAVTREDPAFILADAVLERDLEKASTLVAASFERGLSDVKGRVAVRPEAIFPILSATLYGSWRRAMLVAEAAARGEDPSSVPSLAGLPSFVVERVVRQVSRRDPDDMLARHHAFVEAEAGVRGGGVPPRLAMDRLILSLVR